MNQVTQLRVGLALREFLRHFEERDPRGFREFVVGVAENRTSGSTFEGSLADAVNAVVVRSVREGHPRGDTPPDLLELIDAIAAGGALSRGEFVDFCRARGSA